MDFATDFVLTPHFTGKSERIAETNEIILGNNFPEGLVGASYLVLGEQFIVQNRLQATGSGMDDTIFMEIDACRELANTSPYLNINWKGEDPMELISVVMVKLKEGVTPEQFTKEVRDADIKAKIVFTDTTISAVQNQFTVLLRILIAFWAALVLITAISLFGRFNALARERKKEIGLLRAIGMTGRDIFGLIVIECSMMSALGGVIGSVLATLSMGSIIESLKSAFLLSPSVWTPSIAASGCAMGILVALVLGVLSAAYPAVKSAALDPQVAMTEGEL